MEIGVVSTRDTLGLKSLLSFIPSSSIGLAFGVPAGRQSCGVMLIRGSPLDVSASHASRGFVVRIHCRDLLPPCERGVRGSRETSSSILGSRMERSSFDERVCGVRQSRSNRHKGGRGADALAVDTDNGSRYQRESRIPSARLSVNSATACMKS